MLSCINTQSLSLTISLQSSSQNSFTLPSLGHFEYTAELWEIHLSQEHSTFLNYKDCIGDAQTKREEEQTQMVHSFTEHIV